MIFSHIDNNNDKNDEIYIYAICVYKKHLNNSSNMLFLFLIFLYERMKEKMFF